MAQRTSAQHLHSSNIIIIIIIKQQFNYANTFKTLVTSAQPMLVWLFNLVIKYITDLAAAGHWLSTLVEYRCTQ